MTILKDGFLKPYKSKNKNTEALCQGSFNADIPKVTKLLSGTNVLL